MGCSCSVFCLCTPIARESRKFGTTAPQRPPLDRMPTKTRANSDYRTCSEFRETQKAAPVACEPFSLHNKLQENHQTQEITTVAHPVSFRRAVSSTAAELRLQTFWHRSIPRSRSSRADAFVTLLRAPPYTEYPILRSPRVGFGQPQLEMAGSDGETSFDTWLVAKLDALGLDAEVCSSSFLPHTHLKFCNHLNHPAAQTKQDARRQVDLPPILSCHVGYFDSFRLCHRSVSSRLSGGTTTTYALRQSVIILATYF